LGNRRWCWQAPWEAADRAVASIRYIRSADRARSSWHSGFNF